MLKLDIANTSALVTGGGSGLGAAVCRALAASGARVAVLDRDQARAGEIAAATGGVAVKADVTLEAEVEAALDAAEKAHGTVRILVNCAGIGTIGRVLTREGPMPIADFRRTIEVNLIGSFNVLRLATTRMSTAEPLEDGERGVVINTASVAAFEGQIGQGAYAASKGGIISLSVPIARELARFGIRVNAICPGIFETPLLAGLSDEARDGLASAIPFPRRLGQAAEFADAVRFMVQNRYFNGEALRLDGALRLR